MLLTQRISSWKFKIPGNYAEPLNLILWVTNWNHICRPGVLTPLSACLVWISDAKIFKKYQIWSWNLEILLYWQIPRFFWNKLYWIIWVHSRMAFCYKHGHSTSLLSQVQFFSLRHYSADVPKHTTHSSKDNETASVSKLLWSKLGQVKSFMGREATWLFSSAYKALII